MITKQQQRLQAKYGTYDEAEIIAKMKSGIVCKDLPTNKTFGVKLSGPECKALCDAIDFEYLEGYEDRVIEYTLSTETVDRDGDILIQAGGEFDNYKSNPVTLLFHDSRDFNVGECIKIWYDAVAKATKGWMLFLDDRVDPEGRADRAFRFAKSRAMRAASVGFRGKEVKFPNLEERQILGMKDWGVIFTRWELCEFSFCPVPSNPGAVSSAVRKGAILPQDLQFIETENPKDEVLDMTKEELDALVKTGISTAMSELTVKAGKPISAANLKKMAAIHDEMDAAHKTYKTAHKACMEKMKAFIAEHTPADSDNDGDTDADPTDGDKPKKSAEDIEIEELALAMKATAETVTK